jgi:hypothetical protein
MSCTYERSSLLRLVFEIQIPTLVLEIARLLARLT